MLGVVLTIVLSGFFEHVIDTPCLQSFLDAVSATGEMGLRSAQLLQIGSARTA